MHRDHVGAKQPEPRRIRLQVNLADQNPGPAGMQRTEQRLELFGILVGERPRGQ